MLTVHHWLKTWQKQVDVYISLSEFARTKFIKGGLPAEKLVVRQNFVYPDPGLGDGQENYAVYVGRLSPEKGIETLLEAWEGLNSRIPLKIAGDGPLGPTVAEAAQRSDNIQWLGRLEKPQVIALMKDATLLVLPSLLYENFPMVIAEAYAVGLPVVASNLGSMSSLVHHGVTGAHFRPGDSKDLATQIEWILADSQRLALMRHKARAEFEAKYTAEQNYKTLMSIYQRAIQTSDLRNA
jgi:glycosyltransferase involved in cell wall biosynthesis